MACSDATATEVLTVGDDWVWSYTTASDVSGYSGPVVTIVDADSGDVVATSEDDQIELGAVGDFAATDFDEGVWTWSVESAGAEWPELIEVWTKADVDGLDTTWMVGTWQVQPERAPRSGS